MPPNRKSPAWSDFEDAMLADLWPLASHARIEEALPLRKWKAIQRRAYLKGLKREREALYPAKTNSKAHPLMLDLRRIRQRRRMSRKQLADKSGYGAVMIARWETGATTPSLFALSALCQVLGVKMNLIDAGSEAMPSFAPKPRNRAAHETPRYAA